MHNRLLPLCAAVTASAALGFAGCGGSSSDNGDSDKFQTVSDSDVPFTFQVPKGWKTNANPRDPLLVETLVGPADGIGVRVSSEQTGAAVAALIPQLEADFRRQGFKATSTKERHSGADMTVMRVTGNGLGSRGYYFAKNGRTYQLYCSWRTKQAQVEEGCRRAVGSLGNKS